MRAIIMGLLFSAGEALAHPGHGLTGSHPHGWDYVLLVVAVGVAALLTLRR